MDDGVRVSKKSFANLARFPCILPNIEGHVNHHGRADNVVSRNAAPEAAVKRIEAIVAHHKITLVWNFERQLLVAPLAASERVILVELLSVDPDSAVVNVDGVSRQADDTFNVVRLVGS